MNPTLFHVLGWFTVGGAILALINGFMKAGQQETTRLQVEQAIAAIIAHSPVILFVLAALGWIR